MLSLEVISKNENSFRSKLFNAYQYGLDGSDSWVIRNLQKGEDEIFKIIHQLIYECGLHDKKYEDQKKMIAIEKRQGYLCLVITSYLFIGKDIAVNQGMQELRALAKKQDKTSSNLPRYSFVGSWAY